MRSLVTRLEEIASGLQTLRQPAWRLEIFDVRSTTDEIRDVVVGNPLQPETGPFDASSIVQRVSVNETAGDYVRGGIGATTIDVVIVDAHGQYDLDLLRNDLTAPGRWFRRSNVVRLFEGDRSVDPSDWPNTFTGEIVGQAGYARSRVGRQARLSFRAASREARYLNYRRTSESFAEGTTILTVATSIAENEMGLDSAEISFSSFGTQQIPHREVTLADENPLEMLAKVMFADGFLPRFDGTGRLRNVSAAVPASDDRIYPDMATIELIDRPVSDVVTSNSVCVIGLDSDLTKISQPFQLIATTNLTSGYFAFDEELDTYFAEDRSIKADNVQTRVIRSVVGFFNLGSAESFQTIPAVGDGAEGAIGMKITISTGFAPWLLLYFATVYIVAAFVPDGVALVATVPVGRVLQAYGLIGALLVMTQIGNGQYEFHGNPFEYVFQEIRECAREQGVGEFDLRELEIENHLVNTPALAESLARQAYFREVANGHPRTVTMLQDVALEPNDSFLIETANGVSVQRRFLITGIARSLVRNPLEVKARVACLEISERMEQAT